MLFREKNTGVIVGSACVGVWWEFKFALINWLLTVNDVLSDLLYSRNGVVLVVLQWWTFHQYMYKVAPLRRINRTRGNEHELK